MKACKIIEWLEWLRDYCYTVGMQNYYCQEEAVEILRQECRKVRLIAGTLQKKGPDAFGPLPSMATDPYIDLASLLEWIYKALRQVQSEPSIDDNAREGSDPDPSWKKRAMLLRSEHPDWSHTHLARELGAQQSTRVRSKLFSQAMAWYRNHPEKSSSESRNSETDKKTGHRKRNTDSRYVSDPESKH